MVLVWGFNVIWMGGDHDRRFESMLEAISSLLIDVCCYSNPMKGSEEECTLHAEKPTSDHEPASSATSESLGTHTLL